MLRKFNAGFEVIEVAVPGYIYCFGEVE